MIELPHTVVGAAVAVKVGNPALALPLAFASHFVLDLVPHSNPHLNREIKKFGKVTGKTVRLIAVDTLASLVVGFLIAFTVLPDVGHFLTVIAASFFAVLPDVIEGPYFFLGLRNSVLEKFIKYHSSLQFSLPAFPGSIPQIIIVLAALWWIFA